MTNAPGMGCVRSNFSRSASAGGQLEQPSEVNNSTTTARSGLSVGTVADVPDETTNRKPARDDRTMESRVEDPFITLVRFRLRRSYAARRCILLLMRPTAAPTSADVTAAPI